MSAHDKIKGIHARVGDMCKFGAEHKLTSGTDAQRKVLLELGVLGLAMVQVLNAYIKSAMAEEDGANRSN